MLLGTIDGLLFITSMGTSSEFRIVSSLSKPTFSLKRWEHIILRHFPSSGAKNAGKFLKQYSGHDIKSIIETAVKKGSCEPNTKGRSGYRYIYDFGKQIGTKNTGKATSTIVVVVNEANEVITACPF